MALHQNFINGRFEKAGSGESIPVLNPARDTVISEIPDSSPVELSSPPAKTSAMLTPWLSSLPSPSLQASSSSVSPKDASFSLSL